MTKKRLQKEYDTLLSLCQQTFGSFEHPKDKCSCCAYGTGTYVCSVCRKCDGETESGPCYGD